MGGVVRLVDSGSLIGLDWTFSQDFQLIINVDHILTQAYFKMIKVALNHFAFYYIMTYL